MVLAFSVGRGSHIDPKGQDKLVESLCKRLVKRETLHVKAARKRAQQAVAAMADFSFDGVCLYRLLYEPTEGRVVERMVIPRGGSKALIFNGRKRELTLIRRMRLGYRDSSMQGVHPSARDTLATLRDAAWWPGLDTDVNAWVESCHA